jgi:hypothetical protein
MGNRARQEYACDTGEQGFQEIVRSTAGNFSANGRFVIVRLRFQMLRWIVIFNALLGPPSV